MYKQQKNKLWLHTARIPLSPVCNALSVRAYSPWNSNIPVPIPPTTRPYSSKRRLCFICLAYKILNIFSLKKSHLRIRIVDFCLSIIKP